MKHSVAAAWMIRHADRFFDADHGEVDVVRMTEEFEHVYGVGNTRETLSTAEKVAAAHANLLLARAS